MRPESALCGDSRLLGGIKAKISSLSLNVSPSQTINLFLEMDVEIITSS